MSTTAQPETREMLVGAWRRQRQLFVATLALVASGAVRVEAAPPAAPARVDRVRYEADGGSTRVVVHLSRRVPYEAFILPGDAARGSERRLVLDLSNARLGPAALLPVGVENGLLQRIRTGQFTARTARIVLDLASVTTHSVEVLDDPPRVVIDITGRPIPVRSGSTPSPEPESVRRERPTADEARGRERTAMVDRRSDERRRPASAEGDPRRAAPSTPAPSPRDADEARRPRERDRARPPSVPADAPARSTAGRQADPRLERADRLMEKADRTIERADRTVEQAERATERERRDAERASRGGESRAARDASRTTVPGARPAPPEGERPRIIVLDPGHGGHDPGARGVDGVLEKDVVLAISHQLKERLERGIGATVLLTRSGDETRSLAERTAFANASGADLFISIHANADATGTLQGIETYTLNNTNDRATIRLASMENGPGFQVGRDDLSFILSDMVQSGKEEESTELAQRLHSRVLARLRSRYPDVRNLGVKKGPFYVLVGAYMPCVLVETSFLSHPVEGRRLASPAYQAAIVEGLYQGIGDFLGEARLAKTL